MLKIDYKLFDEHFDINSDYFKNYLLVLEKEETIFHSEKHHVYPKSIYGEQCETTQTLFKLSYKKHFLAHFYLWKSAKEGEAKRKMAKAFQYMFVGSRWSNRSIDQLEDEEILSVMDIFEAKKMASREATLGMKFKPRSDQAKENHRRANSRPGFYGKNNPSHGRIRSKEELQRLSAGIKYGHQNKAKLVRQLRHTVIEQYDYDMNPVATLCGVYNLTSENFIDSEGYVFKDIIKYLDHPIFTYNGFYWKTIGYDFNFDLSTKKRNRKPMSEETKESLRGKVYFTDGVKNIALKPEQPIPEGFSMGLTKHNFDKTKCEGTWYNNGVIEKFFNTYKNEEVPADYIKGRLADWYNNGVNNIFLKKGDTAPEGFKKGFASTQMDSFYVNNGEHHIFLKAGSEIPEGYVLGRHLKRPIINGKGFDQFDLEKNLIKHFTNFAEMIRETGIKKCWKGKIVDSDFVRLGGYFYRKCK